MKRLYDLIVVGSGVLGTFHAFHALKKGLRVAIIEKYLPGRDYRVVVLDGEIISAYERISLSVVGDGKKSILSLLKQKQNPNHLIYKLLGFFIFKFVEGVVFERHCAGG